MFLKVETAQFIVQEYLPEITQGDKRVILFDGDPVGAINRIPSAIDIRANMHVGGKAIKTSLSKNDLENFQKWNITRFKDRVEQV